jgi:protein associated with RNAse G/E
VPAKIDGNIVSFVDLDLDYIQRGGKWQVVDEEEFERNAIIFSYPDELIQRARKELNSLQERIERKQFPFDGTLESFINRIPSK